MSVGAEGFAIAIEPQEQSAENSQAGGPHPDSLRIRRLDAQAQTGAGIEEDLLEVVRAYPPHRQRGLNELVELCGAPPERSLLRVGRRRFALVMELGGAVLWSFCIREATQALVVPHRMPARFGVGGLLKTRRMSSSETGSSRLGGLPFQPARPRETVS